MKLCYIVAGFVMAVAIAFAGFDITFMLLELQAKQQHQIQQSK